MFSRFRQDRRRRWQPHDSHPNKSADSQDSQVHDAHLPSISRGFARSRFIPPKTVRT